MGQRCQCMVHQVSREPCSLQQGLHSHLLQEGVGGQWPAETHQSQAQPNKAGGSLCPNHHWRPHWKEGGTRPCYAPASAASLAPSSYLGAVEAQQDVHLQRGDVEDAVSKLQFCMAQPRPLQPPRLRALPDQLALACQRLCQHKGQGPARLGTLSTPQGSATCG